MTNLLNALPAYAVADVPTRQTEAGAPEAGQMFAQTPIVTSSGLLTVATVGAAAAAIIPQLTATFFAFILM